MENGTSPSRCLTGLEITQQPGKRTLISVLAFPPAKVADVSGSAHVGSPRPIGCHHGTLFAFGNLPASNHRRSVRVLMPICLAARLGDNGSRWLVHSACLSSSTLIASAGG